MNPVVARLAMFLTEEVFHFLIVYIIFPQPGQRTVGKAGQLHRVGQSHHFL